MNAGEGMGDASAGEGKRRRVRRRLGAGRVSVPDDTALLRFLVQSAADLNSSLQLDEVLRRVAGRIKPLIDFDLFCVLLWNERTRVLDHRFALCQGRQHEIADRLSLGRGISGTCALHRSSLRVADVRTHPAYVRHPLPEGEIRSEMAVPLLLKDRLIGVLNLESTRLDAFTEDHEQVLGALASHVAIAVENARLYERLLDQERRLQLDLVTAREIQKSLLSPTIPWLTSVEIGTAYLPASTLGGDFYDFLALGGEKVAVVVGDVAGKGTPAALYGSLAVGTMRGQIVEQACGPAETLRQLNEQLHRPSIDNRFVALAFGIFNGRDRSLTLANAGFTQPIHVRDGYLERVPVRGVPLGMFPNIDYEELRLELRPGDVVAFVSDGLQESIDGQGEQFGDRFLEEVLEALASVSAPQIAQGLIRASTAYAGEDEVRPDDRSVVTLKVR